MSILKLSNWMRKLLSQKATLFENNAKWFVLLKVHLIYKIKLSGRRKPTC